MVGGWLLFQNFGFQNFRFCLYGYLTFVAHRSIMRAIFIKERWVYEEIIELYGVYYDDGVAGWLRMG